VFAGQAAPEPVQFSATSQTPAEGRHVTEFDAKALAGQVGLDPVQCSATSQTPADGRHTVEVERKPSGGQAADDPVQFSAASQTPPVAARQTTVLATKALAGQAAAEPEQFSATSQTPADGRHWVLEVRKWQCESQHTLPAIAVSQSSPWALSTVPLPHKLVSVTVTKWPSLFCVRLGLPGYEHASQPVTLLPSPSRTAASHELLRVVPLQVKVSVCACEPPLLVPSMRALAVWL
jgi:hypothetical protein